MGQTLKTFHGRDLTRRDRTIPDDLGEPTLVLIAHRQWQQREVDRWTAIATDLGLPFLEAPVMDRRFAPMWRFTEGGMARNLPSDVQPRVVCVYADIDRWRRERGLSEGRPTTALLVDRDSRVLTTAYGPPTEETEAELRTAFAQLHRGGSPDTADD